MGKKAYGKTLILAVTRQCNLRCKYCPIDKKNEKMEIETARRAVSLFLEGTENALIRLFGGEPFLNLATVKGVFELAQKRKGLRFDLTTNGLLLKKRDSEFFKKQSNLELILSSAPGRLKSLSFLRDLMEFPQVTINLNLWPGNLKEVARDFSFLIDHGFSRFNFLPAFYVPWENKQIGELSICLDSLETIIRSSRSIFIKNLQVDGPIPLFSPALSVDCNGDLYQGNFFLDKRFEKIKTELKLGNVYFLKSLESVFLPLEWDFEKLAGMFLAKDILSSTKQINQQLNRFCQKIKK